MAELTNRLSRENQFKLFTGTVDSVGNRIKTILNSGGGPSCAKQLKQYWSVIKEYEQREPKLVTLLELVQKRQTESPQYRKGDTCALWAARYFFYRQSNPEWKILDVNIKSTKKRKIAGKVNNWWLATNWHLTVKHQEQYLCVYMKYGKEWDRSQILTTLCAMNLYVRFNSLTELFPTQPIIKYVDLLGATEQDLRDEDYQAWYKELHIRLDTLEKGVERNGLRVFGFNR